MKHKQAKSGKDGVPAYTIAEQIERTIRYIGLQLHRYSRRIGRRVLRLLKKPFFWIGTIFYAGWLFIRRRVGRLIQSSGGDLKDIARDISASRSHLYRSIYIDRERPLRVLHRYAGAAFRRYRRLFERCFHILLPVAGCVAMILTITYFSGVTFALEVRYNGQSLGYIADESIYTEAWDSASQLVGLNQGEQILSSRPDYAVRIVEPGELTDEDTLRDRLIEASDYDLVDACGIYIDGSLLCAVRNETDAIRVMDTMLEPVRQQNPDALVDFVEEVEYVQGLYPDTEEIIWDADRLLDTVSGTKEAAVNYTVQAGDTISGIAQQYDKSSSELLAMNPGLTEEIYLGQVLTVSNEVRFLQVRVIRTELRDEEIPYSTVETDSDRYYRGIRKTTREGENGIDRVTELVSYVNGTKIGAEEVARERIKDPVDKLVTVGTRYAAGLPGGTITSGGGQMLWPVDGLNQVSSPYGYRSSGMHRGLDISGSGATGHRILAAESGFVEHAAYDWDYGYNVIIDHGGGLKTRYAHCSSLSVTAGQYVEMGEVIGRVGNTGALSRGAHLHFEVIRYGERINPLPYIT